MKAKIKTIGIVTGLVLLFGVFIWAQISIAQERVAGMKRLKVVLDSLAQHDREVASIKKTLDIAYDLSEPEQAFYAFFFKRNESDSVGWALFAAVTYIESRFDPTRISSAGAKGLMQFMDTTLMERCAKDSIVYVRDRTARTDAINIQEGINYLLEGQGQGFENMIRRYAGGPGHVKKKGKEKVSISAADIEKYYRDVTREYWKLVYIYRGILKDTK